MASRQVAARYWADSKRTGARRRRAVRVIARSAAYAAPRPAHCELDCAENDYYRFLNYPRD